MKEIILGVAAIGGVGTAAYVGLGGKAVDDFVRTTAKSPQAVYAAMAGLGQSGETSIPSPDGKGRLTLRVVKVPNAQIKLDVLAGAESLVSAEVQLTPEGTGTRIAAELDLDMGAMAELAGAGGEGFAIPGAMEDYLVDQLFARAMDDMVDRIEEGKPLLSLAETRARWGRAEAPSRGGRRTEGYAPRGDTARPQLSTRPALDPNAAAQRQMERNSPSAPD